MTRNKFNWLTTLRRLAKRKTLVPFDVSNLERRASQWPTCACGQLCKRLPRDEDGKPLDDQLRDLGCEFADDISTDNWERALATFRRIEARTAVLLRAQAKERKKR